MSKKPPKKSPNNMGDFDVINEVVDEATAESSLHNEGRIINVELADKYGTWKGSGFGALYQFKQVVLEQVPAHSVKRIVLWQTMSDRDTVGNITDVGIIVSPCETTN